MRFVAAFAVLGIACNVSFTPRNDAPVEADADVIVGPPCALLGLPGASWLDVVALSLVVRDFDGDGIADLAVATGTSIEVHLGNGDSTFRASEIIPSRASFVTAHDIDLDAKLDLVITGAADVVTIIRGNGNGTFQSATTSFATATGPAAVAIADFNGDAIVDLAVPAQSSGPQFKLSLLLGNGDGSFQGTIDTIVGPSTGPTAVTSGFFDVDAHRDVATANAINSTISVMRGNGDGTFMTAMAYPVSTRLRKLNAADLDEDGNLDLVGPSDGTSTDSTTILFGIGDGTFQNATEVSRGGTALAIRDLDYDSHLDLVAPARPEGIMRIALGIGDGTFRPPIDYVSTVNANDVETVDIDGDGELDVIVGGSMISVLLGAGGGKVFNPLRYPTGSDPRSMVTADFDRDGLIDVLTANGFEPTLSLLRGTGAGFAPKLDVPLFSNGFAIAGGDLDHDGTLDVVVSRLTVSITSVLLGTRGDFNWSFDLPLRAHDVALAKLDGDSYLDIIAIERETNTVTTLLGGQGATFGSPMAFATGAQPDQVVVTDLDRDGKPDVVVANLAEASLSVLRGNGDGTLAPRVDYPVLTLNAFAIGDVNGDGTLDLVAVGNTIASVLLGRGDGTFGSALESPSGPFGIGAAAVDDLDGDGHADLVGVNDVGTLVVMRGLGNGTFRPRQVYGAGGFGLELALRDLDRDGRLDVLMCGGNAVTVLRGRCLR